MSLKWLLGNQYYNLPFILHFNPSLIEVHSRCTHTCTRTLRSWVTKLTFTVRLKICLCNVYKYIVFISVSIKRANSTSSWKKVLLNHILMHLSTLKYSGPFTWATGRYLLLITTTLYIIIHWGTKCWNPRQMLNSVVRETASGLVTFLHFYALEQVLTRRPMSWASSAQKWVWITCSQLPVSWNLALRSCACWADVARQPNHTLRQPMLFHKQRISSNLTA